MSCIYIHLFDIYQHFKRVSSLNFQLFTWQYVLINITLSIVRVCKINAAIILLTKTFFLFFFLRNRLRHGFCQKNSWQKWKITFIVWCSLFKEKSFKFTYKNALNMKFESMKYKKIKHLYHESLLMSNSA